MAYERGKRVWRNNGEHAWTFDFNFKSQRYCGSTYTQNRREAERYARGEYDKVVAEWHRTHPNDPRRRARSSDMTFAEAVAAYMDAQGDFDSNRAETAKHLLKLCEPGWIGAETLCSDIDMPMLQKVVSSRRKQPKLSRQKMRGGVVPPQRQVWSFIDGRRFLRPFKDGVDREEDVVLLSSSYVNRSTIDLIKRVLLFASGNYGIQLAPIVWKKVRLAEAEPEITVLTFDEEMRLETFVGQDSGYGDLVRFAILSGLRLENLTDLVWHQIDFDRKTISLKQKGARGQKKQHTIHMDEAIEEILRLQIGRHKHHVFVYQAKKSWRNPKNGNEQRKGVMYPITYWGFTSWWKRCQKATSLRHISPHAFRRTAASRIVRFTGSLTAAQKLLGHADIRITSKHYARFSSDDALQAQRAVRVATRERMAALEYERAQSQTVHKRT